MIHVFNIKEGVYLLPQKYYHKYFIVPTIPSHIENMLCVYFCVTYMFYVHYTVDEQQNIYVGKHPLKHINQYV